MAGPRFSGVFLYLCLCVSSCQRNLNHSQCMYWRMSQFLQRTGQAMNKDAQVRHSTQLVLFIFKLFHIFNVRNWMNKSSCLWRLSLTGSWGGGTSWTEKPKPPSSQPLPPIYPGEPGCLLQERHPGNILVRCQNHLDCLPLLWRSSINTLIWARHPASKTEVGWRPEG